MLTLCRQHTGGISLTVEPPHLGLVEGVAVWLLDQLFDPIGKRVNFVGTGGLQSPDNGMDRADDLALAVRARQANDLRQPSFKRGGPGTHGAMLRSLRGTAHDCMRARRSLRESAITSQCVRPCRSVQRIFQCRLQTTLGSKPAGRSSTVPRRAPRFSTPAPFAMAAHMAVPFLGIVIGTRQQFAGTRCLDDGGGAIAARLFTLGDERLEEV